MRIKKLLAACVFAFGAGLGISATVSADPGDCEIDYGCVYDCKQAGGGVLYCRSICCF